MKIIKKILKTILILIIIGAIGVGGYFGYQYYLSIDNEETVEESETEESEETISYSDDFKKVIEFEEIMLSGFENGKNEVDVSSLNLSDDDENQLWVSTCLKLSPYLYSLYGNTSYSTDGDIIKTIICQEDDVEALLENEETISVSLETLMNEAESASSDMEKALAIHDAIIINNAYEEYGYESHTAGGMLLYGSGVCDAYSNLYQYVMNKLGLTTYTYISDSMSHAWNVIEIDDVYYHVDLTYDDSLLDDYDRLGMVLHDYFLVSDSLINEDHSDYYIDYTCNEEISCEDTSYDEQEFTESNSPVIYYNDHLYYIIYDETSTHSYLLKDGEVFYDLGLWQVSSDESSYYLTAAFSGLFIEDDYIYFNTATEIIRVSLTDESSNTVFTYSGDGMLAGIRLNGDKIDYLNVTYKISYQSVSVASCSIESVTY